MNDNSQIISVLNCALNTNEDEHLCEDPIVLSCGHHICRECRNSKMTNDVKCLICNKINSRDLDDKQNTEIFNSLLNQNLDKLLNLTCEKFKNVFQTYRDTVFDADNMIESHLQFIKEEIFIKVESLKIELDKMYESLINDLIEIEEKWKSDYRNMKDDYLNENVFDIELKKLEETIKRQENITKDDLYYFQNQLKSIKNSLKSFIENSPQLTFKESDLTFETKSIGQLVYDVYRGLDRKSQQAISENKYTAMEVVYLYDLSTFSNGDMLFANHDKSNILQLNKNLELIKTVNLINNKPFRVICLTIDSNDHVYLSDYNNHFIIKTDRNFNELARFGDGEGNASNQINKPSGICCSKDFVYICDKDNRRIQKLDSNLNYQATFNLEFEPWYIKIIHNVAMIRPDSFDKGIHFYNLNDFSLIVRYDHHSGIIGCSSMYFYEYYPGTKMFYCYDKKGELFKSIQTNGFNLTTVNNWGSICISNLKMYLIVYGRNAMIDLNIE